MVHLYSTGPTESYGRGCWFPRTHQTNFSPFFTSSTLTYTPFRDSRTQFCTICGDSGQSFNFCALCLLGFCFVCKSVKQEDTAERLNSMISMIPFLVQNVF